MTRTPFFLNLELVVELVVAWNWPSGSFMGSSLRTDTSALWSTGPERRSSVRLQGELQLCDVQRPAHTQRRPPV